MDMHTDFIKKGAPTLDDPLLANLEAYWKTLRHAQQIPSRSALNPSQIDGALSSSFILQRVAPGTARFRVAGQRLHDLIKMDARGMPFTTLFQPDARDQIKSLTEAAFSEPAIIGLPLVSHGSVLRPTVYGAMVLLPMQDDHGVTNRLLGALITPDIHHARARRFEVNAQLPMRHDRLGLTLATTQLIPKEPAQTQRPDAKQQPALRLVVNNG